MTLVGSVIRFGQKLWVAVPAARPEPSVELTDQRLRPSALRHHCNCAARSRMVLRLPDDIPKTVPLITYTGPHIWTKMDGRWNSLVEHSRSCSIDQTDWS